jgi:hypothetical protein
MLEVQTKAILNQYLDGSITAEEAVNALIVLHFQQ